jgi:LysR family glycine cleavage system transcriptional activator
MAGRPPSLRAISAFEAAARHQSFALAGNELNLTHGAVSHAIRGLETRLGTQLFERRGRGVQLTEEGRILAGRVRLGIGLLSEAFETKPWLQRSKLVVSVLPTFAARFLVPRLADFRARYPDIQLELRASWGLVPVGSGDVDMGLRYGPGGWAGLSAVKIAEEYLFPVSSPLAGPDMPSSPGDLSDRTLIGHREFPWRPWLVAAGLDWPEPKCSLVLDDSMLVLEAAAAGAGIGLGRSLLCRCDLKSGRLVRLFDTQIKADYSYWAVWNPASPKLPVITAFLSWIEDELKDFQCLVAPSSSS